MLLWFAWAWFNPGPAPYRYQLVEEGSADKFPQLGLGKWPTYPLPGMKSLPKTFPSRWRCCMRQGVAMAPGEARLGKPHE